MRLNLMTLCLLLLWALPLCLQADPLVPISHYKSSINGWLKASSSRSSKEVENLKMQGWILKNQLQRASLWRLASFHEDNSATTIPVESAEAVVVGLDRELTLSCQGIGAICAHEIVLDHQSLGFDCAQVRGDFDESRLLWTNLSQLLQDSPVNGDDLAAQMQMMEEVQALLARIEEVYPALYDESRWLLHWVWHARDLINPMEVFASSGAGTGVGSVAEVRSWRVDLGGFAGTADLLRQQPDKLGILSDVFSLGNGYELDTLKAKWGTLEVRREMTASEFCLGQRGFRAEGSVSWSQGLEVERLGKPCGVDLMRPNPDTISTGLLGSSGFVAPLGAGTCASSPYLQGAVYELWAQRKQPFSAVANWDVL